MRVGARGPGPARHRALLIAAADEGRIVCRGAGGDALWLPPASLAVAHPERDAA